MKVWSGAAGQIALGKVDDRDGRGDRGVDRAAGRVDDGARRRRRLRRQDDQPRLASGSRFCALFLLGLADLRRPLSLRNLDLLALLSFSVSLWFFNDGEIFWSVPLAYPPLVYLLGRCVWIGAPRPAAARVARPLWPVWLLAAATRLPRRLPRRPQRRGAAHVIDVGYAGVIGADRIANGADAVRPHAGRGGAEAVRPGRRRGRDPRAHPDERALRVVERARRHLRPGLLPRLRARLRRLRLERASGTRCRRRTRPRSLFDLLCLARPRARRRRFGGTRLAATLAFAWAAYPFTQYASNSNTNDAIMPAFLIWGFWLASSRLGARRARRARRLDEVRGAAARAALAHVPGRAARRRVAARFAVGFAGGDARRVLGAAARAEPLHAARVFVERTFGCQLDRESPFSLWGWGQYHARGIPDLAPRAARAPGRSSSRGALVVAFVPRRKSPLAARRADRRAADRLRARADALVLPLHPVVLPLRRASRCSSADVIRARAGST